MSRVRAISAPCRASLLLAAVAAMVPASPGAGERALPAASQEQVPLLSVFLAVAAWTAAELGLPVASPLPAIVFSDPREMRALLGRDGAASIHGTGPDVVALYDPGARAIHLPRGWTGATPAELSVLVHEMVHHQQAAAGERFACAAEREKAAFAAQARWLELFGGDLERDFGLNDLFLLVTTTCAPP
jgi:hypothetical protein